MPARSDRRTGGRPPLGSRSTRAGRARKSRGVLSVHKKRNRLSSCGRPLREGPCGKASPSPSRARAPRRNGWSATWRSRRSRSYAAYRSATPVPDDAPPLFVVIAAMTLISPNSSARLTWRGANRGEFCQYIKKGTGFPVAGRPLREGPCGKASPSPWRARAPRRNGWSATWRSRRSRSYAAYRSATPVPDDAPPLFIVIAGDDPLISPNSSARLTWRGANRGEFCQYIKKGRSDRGANRPDGVSSPLSCRRAGPSFGSFVST